MHTSILSVEGTVLATAGEHQCCARDAGSLYNPGFKDLKLLQCCRVGSQ